jgi:dihydrofolate reductase
VPRRKVRKSTVISGDREKEVFKLKQQYNKDVAVHGSGQLAPSLLGLGLLEELRSMIFPVVIVDGKRFFGGPRLRRRPEEKEPEPDCADDPQWFSGQ